MGAAAAVDPANVILSGSLAFDYILTFPGSFPDHILPEKVHVLSLSFLFDSLKRLRGGVAGNIAYGLAMLGEKPLVVGAGGPDFADYRAAFESLGLDTSRIATDPDRLTGSSFMLGDLLGNQIAGFYPGASAISENLTVSDLAETGRFGLVGPTTLEAMRRHVAEFGAGQTALIYDPSQQLPALPPEDVLAGIDAAWCVVGSDYEFGMIERKVGLTVDDIAARTPWVVVTLAGEGSVIREHGNTHLIPAVPPLQLADPTGGGDAYRAGLIKGWLLGLDPALCGRLGALAATYAIELYGTQEYTFTPRSFVDRINDAFPDFAGAVNTEWLAGPVTASDRYGVVTTESDK